MGKSLDEIWQKIQDDMKSKRESEAARDAELFDMKEKQRQEYMRRNRMFEALSSQSSAASAAAGGRGGMVGVRYRVTIDTHWIYPQADLDYTLSGAENGLVHLGNGVYQSLSPAIEFTLTGKTYDFVSLQSLINFYVSMSTRTYTTQPVGNAGYSLGVGTILETVSNESLIFKVNGFKVIEFYKFMQITDQTSLPVPANSPVGTVGWGSVYCDWDMSGSQDTTNIAPNNDVDGLIFVRA